MGRQKFMSRNSAESFAQRTGGKVNDVRDDSQCSANYTVRPENSDRGQQRHDTDFDNHMHDLQDGEHNI
jgi:hypothetical protein